MRQAFVRASHRETCQKLNLPPQASCSALPRIFHVSLTVALLLLGHRVFPRMCLCACCTACHMGPGCSVIFFWRGLRFGVRGRRAPPVLEIALSEGRPCSPHGQLRCTGTSDAAMGASSLSLSHPPRFVAAFCTVSSSISSSSSPQSTSPGLELAAVWFCTSSVLWVLLGSPTSISSGLGFAVLWCCTSSVLWVGLVGIPRIHSVLLALLC